MDNNEVKSAVETLGKTFESFNTKGDPSNNCLDTAIITPPKYQTKSTVKKLKCYISAISSS